MRFCSSEAWRGGGLEGQIADAQECKFASFLLDHSQMSAKKLERKKKRLGLGNKKVAH